MFKFFNSMTGQEKQAAKQEPAENPSFNEKVRRSGLSKVFASLAALGIAEGVAAQGVETKETPEQAMANIKEAMTLFDQTKASQTMGNAFMQYRDAMRNNQINTFEWGGLDNRVGENPADTLGRSVGGIIEDQYGNIVSYQKVEYAADSTQEISEKNHKEGYQLYLDEDKDGDIDWFGYFDISQVDRLNLSEWDMNYLRGKVQSDRNKEATSFITNLKKKFRAEVNAAGGYSTESFREISSKSLHPEGTGAVWKDAKTLSPEESMSLLQAYSELMKEAAQQMKNKQ